MNEDPTLYSSQTIEYWEAKRDEAKQLVKLAEEKILALALEYCDGRVTAAAGFIGMSHQTFLNRLAKYPHLNRVPANPRRKPLMTRGMSKKK